MPTPFSVNDAHQNTLAMLRDYESRNVTYIDPDGRWPIVWERAQGVHVWDAHGARYLDLTAAFGVASAGHANAAVIRAGRDQMGRLLHAMGDVHPHALKGRLAQRLSALTFERWSARSPSRGKHRVNRSRGKTVFCNSGFEAVEAALKTAHLATGRPGVIAFEGAYHGLGYGALNTTHREIFRSPFAKQLGRFGAFVPFPSTRRAMTSTENAMVEVVQRRDIGAVLVEPIQARGGIRVPPAGFLTMLRRFCDRHDLVLVFDEIYTGFGRAGHMFACEFEGVMPELICLGKALTGGFPLSACVGKGEVMDAAWPPSDGEAIHTSTYLGHPVGCAMAISQLEQIQGRRLVKRSRELGDHLLGALKGLKTPRSWRIKASGRGLMAGLEVLTKDGEPATLVTLEIVKRLLEHGIIILPEGEAANVLGFTPPLIINKRQLDHAVRMLGAIMGEMDKG